MTRSRWKLFHGFQDLKNSSFHSKFMIKKRSMPIFSLKNQELSFYVYNGKYFLPVKFYESNLKYKVGEFVFTKKKCVRISKTKKKK